MYAAFNTLQLELERLILLRESITDSGIASLPESQDKLHDLNLKIYSHEQGIAVLVRTQQDIVRQQAQARMELTH